MNETPFIISQAQGQWTIRLGERVSGWFQDKDDAILTALIRAQEVRAHGRSSRVLVEEHGRTRSVWDDAGEGRAPRRRGRTH